MSDQEGMEFFKQRSQLGSNAYLDQLYELYLTDPDQVEASCRAYFDSLQNQDTSPDTPHGPVRDAFAYMAQHASSQSEGGAGSAKLAAVMDLVYAYRFVGHQQADIDPLQRLQREPTVDLALDFHGLSEADLDTSFTIKDLGADSKPRKLSEIIDLLKRTYCGHIATEYMHITNWDEKNWVRQRVESMHDGAGVALSADGKQWLLHRLIAADGLEKYLGMKYVGQKRFSLEGGDALIPLVDALVRNSIDLGMKEVVMAMAHRGRLNVLVNVLGKIPADLFAEFEGKHHQSLLSGDVKYHNGFSSDIEDDKGNMLHMALAFNPSHLEIVSPVVEGSVRARQQRRDKDIAQVMGIHMHGDAAFAGQGVVMETFNMSQTRGYRTGGSIHIVINNQIGFTTSHPLDTRSSYYCTDVAKMIEAPIFHVNGDDPEAVYQVAMLALEYRNTFNKDVVIDMVCYRSHGHNEADEPSATQPLMYQIIKKHPVPARIYADKLIAEGVLTEEAFTAMVKEYKQALEAGKSVVSGLTSLEHNRDYGIDWAPFMGTPWDVANSTQIDKKQLGILGEAMNILPEDFKLQRQVGKTIQERADMTAGKVPVNWGYAELMAYATLVDEGHGVRITGEDVGRGTFAHRHAVLHDQATGNAYVPLQHVSKNQANFEIIDSLLSEEAVMAFEYGYAAAEPNTLVIWEAQFGDFANGAQVVIDQFISSGEEKWGRLCGLVLFLPHGQEGMGAEHSSARLERYLQLCAHDNMQVCVPTTPAQHFHLIRRQMLRGYRKPLIVMTPKSLLRHPLVTSTLDDLAKGEFQCVIDEIDDLKPKKVKRVVLCQGKVFYDLLAKRRNENIQDVAIIRLEQLYPFPEKAIKAVLKNYAHVKDIVWCQEEPENQGAWYMIHYPIRKVLDKQQTLTYAGREAFAAPAVGYPSLYHEQQAALVAQALNVKTAKK